MLHLTVDADEARFLELVGEKLGAVARNRFRAALAKPSTFLVDRVLRPGLFRCEPGRAVTEGVYYPVALTAQTPGRNHELALSLAHGTGSYSLDDKEAWAALTFFGNALRPCLPEWDETEGRDVWQSPSERVARGDYHVVTFEHDVPDIGFLAEQVSWVMSRKKPSDSLMGRLFARLSEYADFAGLTVNYSGNKSLHIHVVFDMRLASKVLNLSEVANPRAGFIAHWNLLRPVVRETLGVAEGIEPDPMLRFPEAYRRTPNAYRPVEDDKHLLGLPPGTWVRQATIWEQWRERAAPNASALFFRPGPFHATSESAVPRARRPRDTRSSATGCDLTPEQVAFCEEMLRRHFGEWPRLDGLRHERGRWIARFYNSTADRNPSSILREDHATIHFAGTGAQNLHPRPLEYPLWRMIEFWVEQHERQRRSRAEAPEEEAVLIARPSAVGEHPMEATFREAARDPESARAAAQQFFLDAVASRQLLWVRGPEGVGKSSSLFAEHHRITERIDAPGDPTLALYAFGDYGTAEEKCADFNKAQGGNGFVGVVLPSFSNAYAQACRDLGLAAMSQTVVAKHGHGSLWAAVRALQPRVMEVFRAKHAEMWATVGGARMAAFTVHQVLHGWDRQNPTRAMWAPSFWGEEGDEAERRERATEEMALGLAVHDEVRVESLVETQPREVLEWIRRLVGGYDGAFRGAGLDRQFAAYEAFLVAEGKPMVAGEAIDLGFDEFRRIASLADGHWDFVTTRNSGEYVVEEEAEAGADSDRPDIYAARHGRPWAVQARGWWRGVAPHLVVLTTEALPTAVARRADSSWSVLELEAPDLPRDDVEVHAIRGVTARNLSRLCGEWRQRLGLPDAWVVSNRVADLPRSMTHARARGNNALIGQDVIQTMAFMSPAEYERIQALNAWMRRSDASLLRHIDEFNQTAGRNLGFRGREGVRHHLLVNPRLLALLVEGALGRSRYDLRVHMDRGQRYRVRVG